MSKVPDSIFPQTIQIEHLNGLHGKTVNLPGLSRREYFAGLAMQGELAAQSEESGYYSTDQESIELLAKRSVSIADALLMELAK